MCRPLTFLPVLVLFCLSLAACAVGSGPTVGAQPAPAPIAEPTPLAGIAHQPAAQLLLPLVDLPAGYQVDGAVGAQLHPGPGISSATARYVTASGPQQRHLYLRVSAFGSTGAAGAEFKQEQGDIGRSSTPLASNGRSLGQEWQAYTVDSGAGTSATSSVGLLVRERNYLVNMVLSGSRGVLPLTDLLPLAQRQVAMIATAR